MNRTALVATLLLALALLSRPEPLMRLAALVQPEPVPGTWQPLGAVDVKLTSERRVRVALKPPYARLTGLRFRLADVAGNGCDAGDEKSGALDTVLVSGAHRIKVADKNVTVRFQVAGAPWMTMKVSDFGVNALEVNIRGQHWLAAGVPDAANGPRVYPAKCRVEIEGLSGDR